MAGTKGRSGRKRKPSKQKALEGTSRPDRTNAREPQPTPGELVKPKWLKGEGSAEWDRVAGELEVTGIATPLDTSLLAHYCYLHGLAVAAAKKGEVLSAAHLSRMQGLAAEFGIGPSSRSRLEVLPKKGPNDDESEFEAFKRQAIASQ